MFSYGKVYSKIPLKNLNLLNKKLGSRTIFLSIAKLYFSVFGYPDVAGQMRYEIVEKTLKLTGKESILDAGCGNGIYLHEFANRFKNVGLGIDPKGNLIKTAREINRILKQDNTFMASTLEKLDLKKKRFDRIICLEVLEHIKKDQYVLSKLSSFLKNNGKLFISIPIKGTALPKGVENDPHFKPKPFEHVRSGYELNDLKALAKKAGLRIVYIKPYFFFSSRYLVRFQQFLYKKNYFFLNLILSPLLTVLTKLDLLLTFYPRGYLMLAKRNETK